MRSGVFGGVCESVLRSSRRGFPWYVPAVRILSGGIVRLESVRYRPLVHWEVDGVVVLARYSRAARLVSGVRGSRVIRRRDLDRVVP